MRGRGGNLTTYSIRLRGLERRMPGIPARRELRIRTALSGQFPKPGLSLCLVVRVATPRRQWKLWDSDPLGDLSVYLAPCLKGIEPYPRDHPENGIEPSTLPLLPWLPRRATTVCHFSRSRTKQTAKWHPGPRLIFNDLRTTMRSIGTAGLEPASSG